VALFALAVAVSSLPGYYTSATARDNYAGVARYVAAFGDPAKDLVLLDAPGQQEVWAYYDPGVPVLALPAQRPADRAATEAALADATTDKRRIFSLFWATDEADPQRIVESWLDANAFKGLESWQGNLRFVTYVLPDDEVSCTPVEPPQQFGDLLALEGWCVADDISVASGDAALVALQWRGLAPLPARYKVSVQLLDGARQVMAQHDSEPAGGSAPTTTWQVGQEVIDNHGLFIPLGTPPAPYRLTVAVYDAESGTRLPTRRGDSVELGEITVIPQSITPPLDVIDMMYRVDQPLGPVTLVGYDQYKLGFAHAPTTSLAPGDTVEFVFYWQAPDPLPADWPPTQTFGLRLGEAELISPLAGASLPTAAWRSDQLIRVTVQLPVNRTPTQAVLSVNDESIMLEELP
jgi:hypothetical protein